MRPRPVMNIVAGPPGSGKTEGFALVEFNVDLFNIDDVCASRNPTAYVGIPPDLRRQVSAECRDFVLDHIAKRKSFSVETTLRTRVAVEQAILAKAAGFETVMYFVTCPNVEENIRRVKYRARAGGHSAPEVEIRQTYEASLLNLREAVTVFEQVYIFESGPFTNENVAVVLDGEAILRRPKPAWLARAFGDR